MNYEIDVIIDSEALDVEWLNQPALAMKYGKHWADCMRTHQQAEENVKLVRSELIKQASENPDKYLDGVKATGPVLEAYYRNHKKHIKAKEELVIAQYELNIAEIAKKEISTTRKAALQNLVELHGQHYFAGPSVPRDLSYENTQKEKQKNSNTKVGKKLTRKIK